MNIDPVLSSGDNVSEPLVQAGNFTVTYQVADVSGNVAVPVTRPVTVMDVTAPIIDSYALSLQCEVINNLFNVSFTAWCVLMQIFGGITCRIGKELAQFNLVVQGGVFSDPGATAVDETDGDITATIVTSSNLDVSEPGKYVISYTVADMAGNQAIKKRKVTVVEDTSAPTLNLQQPTVSTKQLGYLPDPTASATDMAFTCNDAFVCNEEATIDLGDSIATFAAPEVLESLASSIANLSPDTYLAIYSVADNAGQ